MLLQGYWSSERTLRPWDIYKKHSVGREAFERKVVEDAEHHAEHVVERELRRLEADGTVRAPLCTLRLAFL